MLIPRVKSNKGSYLVYFRERYVIFHYLKITVSQLLEMIDHCSLFIFFIIIYLIYLYIYVYFNLLRNDFIFYFYFYFIFILLLYFWYCNLFNLYCLDAKALSVNKCRCRQFYTELCAEHVLVQWSMSLVVHAMHCTWLILLVLTLASMVLSRGLG